MRKLVLYIAVTLDGYIADDKGSVSFLEGFDPGEGYTEFYRTIDALIMGGNTYRQVTQELAVNNWPYQNKKCYVYTSSRGDPGDDIEFTRLPPIVLLERIRRVYASDIWLVGGGQIIRDYLTYDLVDRMILNVVPVLLGRGISLFPPGFPKLAFNLVSSEPTPGGMMILTYERRRAE